MSTTLATGRMCVLGDCSLNKGSPRSHCRVYAPLIHPIDQLDDRSRICLAQRPQVGHGKEEAGSSPPSIRLSRWVCHPVRLHAVSIIRILLVGDLRAAEQYAHSQSLEQLTLFQGVSHGPT